jgi:hypothetical protein
MYNRVTLDNPKLTPILLVFKKRNEQRKNIKSERFDEKEIAPGLDVKITI